MSNVAPSFAAVYWAMGILGTFVVAIIYTMFTWSSRITDLARSVASIATATEIYDRAQARMSEQHARSQESLLKTIQAITAQHAEMYRDLQSRFSTLEERSNNHGTALRQIAEDVHDTRTESRDSIVNTRDELRSEIQRVDDAHRGDMARIQMRRQGDHK